jgi:hypothetical protein
MDDLESVIVSVSGEVAVADSEKWFEVLTGTYDEIGADWAAFRDALPARAEAQSFGPSVTEPFVLTMNDVSGPAEVLRQLSERRDQLPNLYGRLVEEERQALAEFGVEQPEPVAGEQPESVADEQAEPVAEWDAETGKAWYDDLTSDDSGWSGDEEVWDQFVTYFLYRADLRGVTESAQAFLDNILLFDGKIAGFAAYGIAITVPAADEPAEEEPAAEPLPAAISGEIVDRVMAPAIANAVQKMAADGDFSADDIQQVLNEARARITTSQ